MLNYFDKFGLDCNIDSIEVRVFSNVLVWGLGKSKNMEMLKGIGM